MVLIDVLMEPLSNQLDFWSWKNNVIPFSNYIDWFLVAILNQTIFSYLDYKSDMSSWSLGYITILILFFFSFYI
jgi:putative membrane protein